MDKKPDASNAAPETLQQFVEKMMAAIHASNQEVIASNQQLMNVLTAPKVITAPDGRQYTAQTALN